MLADRKLCYIGICACLGLMCFFTLNNLDPKLSDSAKNRVKLISRAEERETLNSTETIQLRRKKRLKEQCDKMHSLYLNTARFYADERNRLLYCYIPKAACTSLKKLLLIISRQVGTNDPHDISRDSVHEGNTMRKLEAFNNGQISRLGMGNFTKFLFVRHPFDRLVSAYRDKFVDNSSNVYQMRIGRKIVRDYRANPSGSSLAAGHDVTFPEFVSYLIDRWRIGLGKELDVHWRPMADLCLPCSINYELIGTVETFSADINLLLEKVDQKLAAKRWIERQNLPSTNALLRKSLMDQLNPSQLRFLLKVYEADFALFGYDP